MSEPTTVHVDITTSIENGTTGYAATFCTQETLTVPANQDPQKAAMAAVHDVGFAHAGQIQRHSARGQAAR